MLANRPDIMREDYMNELCVLQDDVPSFPDDQVRWGAEEGRGRGSVEGPWLLGGGRLRGVGRGPAVGWGRMSAV